MAYDTGSACSCQSSHSPCPWDYHTGTRGLVNRESSTTLNLQWRTTDDGRLAFAYCLTMIKSIINVNA